MSTLHIDFGPEVDASIARTTEAIRRHPDLRARYPDRWLAIALLDHDPIEIEVASMVGGEAVIAVVRREREHLAAVLGPAAATAIPGVRYQWINDTVGDVVTCDDRRATSASDRVDAIVTNRFLGIPIFLTAMWAVFMLTTALTAPIVGWLGDAISGPVAGLVAWLPGIVGLSDTWIEHLLTDGVLVGVGAVVAFIPILIGLYLALAALEDSGYMARAAFVMDRAMGSIGLHGKSFLPMLVGFGCTVPAIYAARTIENPRQRTLTILLVPFMSCGARLPVYVLISAVFLPDQAGLAVFAMYLLGIAISLLVGIVLRRSLVPTETTPTILELPAYRMPTLRSLGFHTTTRTMAFLREASTVILATSVVVWLLMAIPVGGTGTFGDASVEDSAFGAVATAVAPALAPLGLDSPEAAGALLSGLVAKEVIISTMAQSYDSEPDRAGEPSPGLTDSISASFAASSGGHGALAGLAFMVFVLLYTPCMAAAAAERQEIGSRWMWGSIVGQTCLAWTVAMLIFQAGMIVVGLL